MRQRRKELKLTLKDVAEKSGLSFSFISQIERGQTTPSLTSLLALSRALGSSINHFLVQPTGGSAETRHNKRVPYAIGPNAATYERLSTNFPGSVLSSALITEPPGRRTEAMSHEGEEFIFMVEGALTVEVEGETFVLEQGDSLHYASTRTHTTWNHTDRIAVMLHTCTMEYFGDGPDSAP
ncbi:XRE family transcriptional regulator (plasmid) [Ensifer adhaerens]|nr:XRE family transcriptional regulator [Ensifer adhaerens]UAY05773.1 XRE family transcriptional regulator [Ensifer adhaerens]UAY13151.1 XRE family transcriptional regulator [Ensifer adhaerens]